MIRGLLVDLDNTLLRLDAQVVVDRYTRALAARLCPDDPRAGLAAVRGASFAVAAERDGRTTNLERFLSVLAVHLGEAPAAVWPRLAGANEEAAASLAALGRAVPGAPAMLAEARRRGLRVAVASDPTLPRLVVEAQMRSAGLARSDVDFVACLEDCSDTKPHLGFFVEVAAALGLELDECLMVGDDPACDVPDRPCALTVQITTGHATASVGRRVRRGALADVWSIWADRLPAAAAPCPVP